MTDAWTWPERIVATRNKHSSRIVGHWRLDGMNPAEDCSYVRATPELLALVEKAKELGTALIARGGEALHPIDVAAVALVRTMEKTDGE